MYDNEAVIHTNTKLCLFKGTTALLKTTFETRNERLRAQRQVPVNILGYASIHETSLVVDDLYDNETGINRNRMFLLAQGNDGLSENTVISKKRKETKGCVLDGRFQLKIGGRGSGRGRGGGWGRGGV